MRSMCDIGSTVTFEGHTARVIGMDHTGDTPCAELEFANGLKAWHLVRDLKPAMSGRIHDTFHLPVIRYVDPDGSPTCAANFETGDVCALYLAATYSGAETCVFAQRLSDGTPAPTRRRRNGEGSLIPQATCPLWKEREV